MASVFISYSRNNRELALGLKDALENADRDVWIDLEDLPPSSIWRLEIQEAIEGCVAFIYLLSQDSISSKYCRQEFQYARELNKKIIPVLLPGIKDVDIPAEVSEIQWLQWSDFEQDLKNIDKLQELIDKDYTWVKFHAELTAKAKKWERKKDNSRLLRGKELREAEEKLNVSQKEPQLTNLQKTYITNSRKAVTRQRWTVFSISISVVIIIVVLSIFSSYQKRISRARELASESQTVLEEFPQLSLLLSIEALNTLRPGDPILPETQQGIRDALMRSGGIALGEGFSITTPPIISPDSGWLAAGTNDGRVKLWDLTVNDPVSSKIEFTAHEGSFRALTISADNRWLVTAGEDSPIRLWSLIDSDHIGQNSIELLLDDCSVSLLKTSPNGHWLIIICDDDTVRMWDLNKADPAIQVINLPGATPPPGDQGFGPATAFIISDKQQLLAVSTDGRWLALASEESAFLWDLSALGFPLEPAVLSGHNFSIVSLAISPDSKWLATAGFDKTILLWDLTNSDPGTNAMVLSEQFQVSSIGFTPDSHWLTAGGSDGSIRLWDLTSPSPESTYFDVAGQTTAMNVITVSPDNRWLVSAGNDISLMAISSLGYDVPPQVLDGYAYPVVSIEVSPDSLWLVTLSTDTSLRLWDLSTLQPHASPITLWTHSEYGSLRAIATSPVENHWLATSGGNGVAVWDLTPPDFQKVPVFLNKELANLLKISPDNHWLAADGQDGLVLLWDLTSLESIKEPRVLSGHGDKISALDFSSDSQWLVTASLDQTVRIWNLALARPEENSITLPGNLENISSLSINPNNDWLVAVGSTSTYLWNFPVADQSGLPKTISENNFQISGAVFSPDNRWLAVGKDDVRLLDLNTPDLATKHVFNGVGTPEVISSDGKWLITRNFNTPTLLRLDNLSTEPIPLPGYEERLTGIVVSSDDRWLATGSWDNTAKLWNLQAKELAGTAVILHSPATWLPHVEVLATTPDSRWLIMGVEGGSVYLWPLQQDELIQLACKTVNRNFTQTEWQQYFLGEEYRITCPQWPVGE